MTSRFRNLCSAHVTLTTRPLYSWSKRPLYPLHRRMSIPPEPTQGLCRREKL